MELRIKHKEQYLITGRFKGKYYGYLDAPRSDPHKSEYKIYIYEGLFQDAVPTKTWWEAKSDEKAESYNLRDLSEVLIETAEKNVGQSITFKAKLAEIWIRNVELSLVQKEGGMAFGTITGEAIALVAEKITYEEEDLVLKAEVPDAVNSSSNIPISKPTQKRERPNLGELIGIIQLIFGILFLLLLVGNFLAALSPSDWASLGLLLLFGFLVWLLRPVLILFKYIFQSISAIVLLGFVFFLLLNYYVSDLSTTSSQERPPVENPHKTTFFYEDEDNPESLSYIEHHLKWNDYQQNFYEGRLRVFTDSYLQSKTWREGLIYTTTVEDWPSRVFSRMVKRENDVLDFYTRMIDSIQSVKKLDQIRFAELIVTMIQEIPYVLLLPDLCPTKSEFPCIGDVTLGIHTPVEFLYTLQGDCDTRALLVYLTLKRYGYDVVLLVSHRYQHALIGINLPHQGTFFPFRGKRYYLWETTSKGWRPGEISPNIRDMSYWEVVLAE